MTSQPTKNTKTILIIIIALLGVGLFYFLSPSGKGHLTTQLMKPSQMNFSQHNNLQENQLPAEPAVSETVKQTQPAQEVEAQLNESDKKIWSDLKQIIASKNDNDPRLDNELKKLSPQLHQVLYKQYEATPDEERNVRGLIAFLITRNLSSSADLEFVQKIFQENPCLSLEDCKKAAAQEDPHHSSVTETTLNYPQLSQLYQIERQLTDNPQILKDPQMRAGIVSVLRTAENFPAPQVHNKAHDILVKFGL
ncbi:MAG: hypothetical protein ACXWQQ_14385 [Pseudobdellovibrio sp.]